MLDKKCNIHEGEIIIVTSGQYSGYSIHYVAKALKTFNVMDIKTEYLKTQEEEKQQYHFRDYEFIEFLLTGQYLLPVKIRELCIHGYGEGLISMEEYGD